MSRPELTGVAGVPEVTLDDARLARLPEPVEPAPWVTECRAVLWLARGGRSAGRALPSRLRRGRVLAVVGAMVRYTATPVGAYDEVCGVVVARDGARPWAHVAFMSVDSEASLVSGRVNWAVPKSLGAFDGEPGHRRTMTAVGGDAARWRVSARPTVVGPRIPVRGGLLLRQLFPGARVGDSRLTGRGRARLAIVSVEVDSDGPLPTWLRPGRHLGLLLEDATVGVSAPELS